MIWQQDAFTTRSAPNIGYEIPKHWLKKRRLTDSRLSAWFETIN